MCFSATSSFAATGMLTGIGILSLFQVRKKSEYITACIPFGFALQQFSEGVIWQTYGYFNSMALMQTMTYIFLIFAMAVWPIWIPLALWAREQASLRKKLLMFNLLWGIVVATYGTYILVTNAINVGIVNHSIEYLIGYETPTMYGLHLFAYVLAVILPFFISGKKIHWAFGVLLAASLVLSFIVWSVTLISVWCFFSALLSMLIFIDLYKK
jgi:hypothetical protein